VGELSSQGLRSLLALDFGSYWGPMESLLSMVCSTVGTLIVPTVYAPWVADWHFGVGDCMSENCDVGPCYNSQVVGRFQCNTASR
jgi:hypothetical protein